MSKLLGISEMLASIAAALYFIFIRVVNQSFSNAGAWLTFSLILSALLIGYFSIARKYQRCSIAQYIVVLTLFVVSNYGQWHYLAGCGEMGIE